MNPIRMPLFQPFLVLLASLAAGVCGASHDDGGWVTPRHLLPLWDTYGEVIVPGDPNATPPSWERTCGQCHEVSLIAQGFHFGQTNLCSRMPEPWFWVDGATASQIPVGVRPFAGLYSPERLGLDSWDFTALFGRNLPGGGISAPADTVDAGGRWEVTGRAEMNCFACHGQGIYDHSEYVRQMERQNWRWASAAATGLGEVLGMGSRMADSWCPMMGANPDDRTFAVAPSIRYDLRRFDDKKRTDLNVGRPRDESCLNCHSVAPKGVERQTRDRDVHAHAGLRCVDCHRNGIDHAIARGVSQTDARPQDTTCAGCHAPTGGRFGAPVPEHKGFPPVHFAKLSCTVCHSGVTPGGQFGQVRTARANRIGIYGRAIWATDAPFIVEPVFVTNALGKIEPRRMMWPAFWAERDADGSFRPIPPDQAKKLLGEALAVRERAGKILQAVADDDNLPGQVALSIDGELFSLDGDKRAVPMNRRAETLALYSFEDASFQPLGKTVANQGVQFVRIIDGICFAPLPLFDSNEPLGEQLHTALCDQLLTLDNATENGHAAILWQGQIFRRIPIETVTTNEAGRIDITIPWVMQPAPCAEATGVFPRLVWFEDGTCRPLLADEDAAAIRALGAAPQTLTEDLVAKGLRILTAAGKSPAYVANGKRFELRQEKLLAFDDPIAEPVSWPLAHDVRPARMAKGSSPNRCAACHTPDSDFFFRTIHATGPLLSAQSAALVQNQLIGVPARYHRVFGWTFRLRPLFKLFLSGAGAFLLLVVLSASLTAIPKAIDCSGTLAARQNWRWLTPLSSGVALCAIAFLGLSGFGGWLAGGMTQWVLVGHQMAAGALVAALLVLVLTGRTVSGAPLYRTSPFVLLIAATVGLVLTALLSMMRWFGTDGQFALLEWHRYFSLAALVLFAFAASRLLRRS
ncbi:MAG: hypothetical protein ACI4QD_05955 [Kiritimatiellia bacterium]